MQLFLIILIILVGWGHSQLIRQEPREVVSDARGTRGRTYNFHIFSRQARYTFREIVPEDSYVSRNVWWGGRG